MLGERFVKPAVGMALLMGGWACSAQQAPVSFGQIQRDAQLSAMLTAPSSGPSMVFSAGPASANSASAAPSVFTSSAAAGFVRAPVAKASRTLDARYFLLNSMDLGMAGLDMAMTRHCIADHHCGEGNPLMPSSLAGQLSVGIAFVGYDSVSSYWLKKHQSRLWWVPPFVGTAAHGVGALTGFVHR